MDSLTTPAPRRIFRVTFTMADGTKRWRFVRCPYRLKSPQDWTDSLVGMQTSLAEMVMAGTVERFTISAPPPERTHAAAEKSVRWHEVLATIAA
jgi:hypothetical protein